MLRRLFVRAEPDPPLLAPADAPAPPTESRRAARRSWFARLASGLSRTSASIGQGIVDIVSKRRLDAAALDDLEEVLIRADLGVAAASRIREAVGRGRHDKAIEAAGSAGDPRRRSRTHPGACRARAGHRREKKPFVILVVGVNGSGKTTTIGKLAAKFAADGLKVTLAAGDTFRAAAIEQLRSVGGAERRRVRRARTGRRRGRPRFRRDQRGARRRVRRVAGGHRRPLAKSQRADGRT